MSDVDRHEKLAACGASNCRRTQARKYTRKHQPRLCEFISFVTGEASDKCHKEKRKTVNADEILWASGNLGFYNDVESLKGYLVKYRELEGERADQNKPASSANENQTDERQQGASPPPFSFNLMGKRRT